MITNETLWPLDANVMLTSGLLDEITFFNKNKFHKHLKSYDNYHFLYIYKYLIEIVSFFSDVI